VTGSSTTIVHTTPRHIVVELPVTSDLL